MESALRDAIILVGRAQRESRISGRKRRLSLDPILKVSLPLARR
jgi:hypothetical protein